jgi:hypothetical protein
MKLLKNSDLIWEEKGIIIGIMHFLLHNIRKIKRVYIEDPLYYKIIKSIFPVLKVYDKFNDEDKRDKSGINICIKTISDIKDGYLVLNNINNIDKIKTKRKNFFLLPWFNCHNPIIMFKYNKDVKEMDTDKLKRKIKKFNKRRLGCVVNGPLPLLTYRCNIIFWDMFLEYYILKKYAVFFNIDVNSISDYLYRKINSFNCPSCNQQPKIIPMYIPYIDVKKQHKLINEKNILEDENTNKKQNAKVKIIPVQVGPPAGGPAQKFLFKFLSTVNKKISVMNNLLFENIKNI